MTGKIITLPKSVPMKLEAQDHEDLHLLSAHMQDALVPVTGLDFTKELSRFHLTANRFRWELDPHDHEGAPLYFRTHCNLSFGHVERVQHKGFDLHHPTHVLSLLAIRGHEDGTVTLYCSEGATLRLYTQKIHCRLCDVGEHWPTRIRPQHAA